MLNFWGVIFFWEIFWEMLVTKTFIGQLDWVVVNSKKSHISDHYWFTITSRLLRFFLRKLLRGRDSVCSSGAAFLGRLAAKMWVQTGMFWWSFGLLSDFSPCTDSDWCFPVFGKDTPKNSLATQRVFLFSNQVGSPDDNVEHEFI